MDLKQNYAVNLLLSRHRVPDRTAPVPESLSGLGLDIATVTVLCKCAELKHLTRKGLIPGLGVTMSTVLLQFKMG